MKLFSINKSKLNLSIDIIMFMLLIPVAGIGFLMKYVIVSGTERNIIYGNNVDLEFFGLTRHQWGTVHLTLSLIFLTMLILHIILHWRVIVSVFNQMIPALSISIGITLFLILFCLIILISPFFLLPEKVPFEPKHRNRINNFSSSFKIQPETTNNKALPVQKFLESEKPANTEVRQYNHDSKSESDHHNSDYGEYEVFGYHTLQYISDRYNVPVSYLAGSLIIPENLSGQKLGWLKRKYPFSMSDVRKSISDYKKR